MSNIRDLLTAEDALDLEGRFDEVIQDHKEYEEEFAESFRAAQHAAVFDWEFDLPEDFFI